MVLPPTDLNPRESGDLHHVEQLYGLALADQDHPHGLRRQQCPPALAVVLDKSVAHHIEHAQTRQPCDGFGEGKDVMQFVRRHVQEVEGRAAVSVRVCRGGDWGGWTGVWVGGVELVGEDGGSLDSSGEV